MKKSSDFSVGMVSRLGRANGTQGGVTRNEKGRNVKDVARKAKQSWMKGEDFAAIRDSLGYTQVEFARLLGVTSVSISNYELDKVPIPKMLYMLLTAVKQKKIKLQ